jgi:hypothetical protein
MSLVQSRCGRVTAARPVPKADRAETIDQAQRWDVQKSRALAFGICDRCGAEYAWGLADGFAIVHPPCAQCARILGPVVGDRRPNGWTNVRLENVGPADTGKCPHAHRSRNTTPGKYLQGYGSCRACEDSWTGFAVCHCASCCHTFADITAFDQHRLRGHCQDTATRGLVKIHRAHWTGWSWPTATPDGCAS